jgi:acyl-CoA thioesterase-1
MMKCANFGRHLFLTLTAVIWIGIHCFSAQARADQNETVIVALGDSLTSGFGLPNDKAFPSQL